MSVTQDENHLLVEVNLPAACRVLAKLNDSKGLSGDCNRSKTGPLLFGEVVASRTGGRLAQKLWADWKNRTADFENAAFPAEELDPTFGFVIVFCRCIIQTNRDGRPCQRWSDSGRTIARLPRFDFDSK